MNAHVTTGIRELTAQELDQVSGGLYNLSGDAQAGFDAAIVFTVAVTAVVGFFSWLFG
jgi:lactobin A/cerein 7B family class IIb bacteriocin